MASYLLYVHSGRVYRCAGDAPTVTLGCPGHQTAIFGEQVIYMLHLSWQEADAHMHAPAHLGRHDHIALFIQLTS